MTTTPNLNPDVGVILKLDSWATIAGTLINDAREIREAAPGWNPRKRSDALRFARRLDILADIIVRQCAPADPGAATTDRTPPPI